MGDGVEPRTQRAGILELADAAQDLDPHLLEHVQPTILTAGQTGRIVEQRTLHAGNQILECTHIARLATERDPLIVCSIFFSHVPSLIMSTETHPRITSIT